MYSQIFQKYYIAFHSQMQILIHISLMKSVTYQNQFLQYQKDYY